MGTVFLSREYIDRSVNVANLTPSTDEVQNKWRYNSTPPIRLIRLRGVDSDNFAFTFRFSARYVIYISVIPYGLTVTYRKV
jgi:hypothetical protein